MDKIEMKALDFLAFLAETLYEKDEPFVLEWEGEYEMTYSRAVEIIYNKLNER